MSLPPEFKSNLPESLLTDINPRDRYLLEQVSIIGQKSDWLLSETQKQSHDITEIKSETKATNGKVAQTMRDLADVKRKDAEQEATWLEVKKIVTIKQFIQKYLFNRYFLGFLFVFGFGVIKILTNEELRAFFFKLIRIS